jgi:tRNA nucleotidyltransferase/poly(A) polymerase
MLQRPSAGEALRLMHEVRLAEHVLPELFASTGSPLYESAVARVQAVARRREVTLAFSALLADLPGKSIRAICRRWGAANDLAEAVTWMAAHLNDWTKVADATATPLHAIKRLMAHPHFDGLRRLWTFEERRMTGRLTCARGIRRRVRAINPSRVAPPPFVTGDDLQALGLTPGPRLGRILRTLYERQLDEELTTREQAIAEARRFIEAEGK